MSDTAVWFALCLVFILLVPLSIAGLALINTGLGRSRSAAHGMTSSLSVVAVAGLVYFVFGFSVQAYPVNFAKMVMADQRVLGAPGLFLRGVDYGFPLLPVVLGIFSVGLASIVPLGAAADRLRLGAACLATVIFAGLTYPGFAHWAVNGFLSQLVSNPAIGRSYLDDGGSGMIQASGGFRGDAALSTWLMRIAINLANDYQRSRRLQFWRALVRPKQQDTLGELVESFADDRPSAERSLIARQQVQRAWQAAQKLSAQQRAVFLLRFVDEMEMREIAQATGLAEGTVKVHLLRAVRAIRKALQEG